MGTQVNRNSRRPTANCQCQRFEKFLERCTVVLTLHYHQEDRAAMPSHNEYPASSALALEIIDCWNEKDMERLLQSYHPACVGLYKILKPYLCIETNFIRFVALFSPYFSPTTILIMKRTGHFFFSF